MLRKKLNKYRYTHLIVENGKIYVASLYGLVEMEKEFEDLKEKAKY